MQEYEMYHYSPNRLNSTKWETTQFFRKGDGNVSPMVRFKAASILHHNTAEKRMILVRNN
jgi:hypothetical protein